jgi:hypothetical protein
VKLARSLGALALAAAMTLEAAGTHADTPSTTSTTSTPPPPNRKRELRSSGIALFGLGSASALVGGLLAITGLAVARPGTEGRRLELTAAVGFAGFAGLAFAGGVPLFLLGAPVTDGGSPGSPIRARERALDPGSAPKPPAPPAPAVSLGPRGVTLAWSF